MGSCFSSNQAKHFEEQAKSAAKAYSEFNETQPGVETARLLRDTIARYNRLLDELERTRPKEGNGKIESTKFTLANYHLKAGELATNPRSHLEEAKTLYDDLLKIWPKTKPPLEYPEFLWNFGRIHYDLFKLEQDKAKNGATMLQEACGYYESYLLCPLPNNSKTCAKQMIGIITSTKCQLERNDIKLDQSIRYLFTVFNLDSNFFNDAQHWKNTPLHDITSRMAASVDRNPHTSRIRDLALLSLCQALVFRYNFKRHGDPFDLQRAEAVASSAIPFLSSEKKGELEELLIMIKERNQSAASGPSTKVPLKVSEKERASTSASITTTKTSSKNESRIQPRHGGMDNTGRSNVPYGNTSPQHSRTSTTKTGTTGSTSRHEPSIIEPQNNFSKVSLTLAKGSNPSSSSSLSPLSSLTQLEPRTVQTSSTTTVLNTQGHTQNPPISRHQNPIIIISSSSQG